MTQEVNVYHFGGNHDSNRILVAKAWILLIDLVCWLDPIFTATSKAKTFHMSFRFELQYTYLQLTTGVKRHSDAGYNFDEINEHEYSDDRPRVNIWANRGVKPTCESWHCWGTQFWIFRTLLAYMLQLPGFQKQDYGVFKNHLQSQREPWCLKQSPYTMCATKGAAPQSEIGLY